MLNSEIRTHSFSLPPLPAFPTLPRSPRSSPIAPPFLSRSFYPFPHTLPLRLPPHTSHPTAQYMWINQKHFGDSSLLRDKDMSVLLRQDVLLFLYKDVVQKVPFFNNIGEKDDNRFLVRVCEELRPRIYLPSDFIIMEGTTGEEMYILSKGTVEVRSQAQDILLSTLKPGCFFGEISLILREKRTASIKAKTIAEVSVLTATVRGGTGMEGGVVVEFFWDFDFITAPRLLGRIRVVS